MMPHIDIAEASRAAHPPTMTSSALDSAFFAAPKFIVPGYIAQGASVLAGAPKIGKSWLALAIAHAVASGGQVLGQDLCDHGDVLALCLEDTPRRLQGRLRAIRQGAPPSDQLHLATSWPMLDEGGLDAIKAWLDDHDRARLVLIDTWQKVKPKTLRDATAYEADYRAVSGIKALADDRGIGVLLVHHRRKAEASDVLDTVSGSTGFTGALDGVLILKRDRAAADAVLFTTGRDLEEREDALSFDKATGLWNLIGPADDYRRSQEQVAIIRLLNEHGTMTPAAVAEALDKNRATVRWMLAKMATAGTVEKTATGHYRARA